jgi:hypothetical protein
MAWDAEVLFKTCGSLDDVFTKTVTELQGYTESGLEIHYVAGTISSDGDEYIERNIAELLRLQAVLTQQLGEKALVLTSPVIFTPAVYDRLKVFELPREERELKFQNFWDKIITSGYMTGIHFAPKWERSIGTKLEHEAATQQGIDIYYL